MTFGDLFERAAASVERGTSPPDTDAVSDALAAVRAGETCADEGPGETGAAVETAATASPGEADSTESTPSPPSDPSPARVVADADVLAADLLVGGVARDALDVLRSHAWTTLVASDPLLADAEAVVASLAGDELAADWRATVEEWREPVAQPRGDHPALASAYRGGAMQVISLDPSLTGPGTAAGLRDRFRVSVRDPLAFTTVFDPARLYPEAVGGEYPGPDRDARTMESA